MPNPRSRTGAPLSSSRAPSTWTVLMPTGREYSSSPCRASRWYRYGSSGLHGRAWGTSRTPSGPLPSATTAPAVPWMGGGVAARHGARARPRRGHPAVALVPPVAYVLALRGLGDQVVVAGRDGHLPRARQGPPPPPAGRAFAPGVEPEPPQPVEAAAVPAAAVPWCQHRQPSSFR